MADDQRRRPIEAFRQAGAETGGAIDDRGFGFFLGRPPDHIDGGEIVPWPVALQLMPRRADVAGEGVTLADDRVDGNRQVQRGGDWAGGLQCTGVGRNDNLLDLLAGELSGGLLGLGVAERGQGWIDDAGVASRDAEVQVELALAVAQQNHVNRLAWTPTPGKFPDGIVAWRFVM